MTFGKSYKFLNKSLLEFRNNLYTRLPKTENGQDEEIFLHDQVFDFKTKKSFAWNLQLETTTHLKVSVDAIKSLGVCGQLVSDILGPDKDTLQMGPGSLYLHPDPDHLIGRRQFLLPSRDFLQEVGDVFGGQHVLELYLKSENNSIHWDETFKHINLNQKKKLKSFHVHVKIDNKGYF